MSKLSTPDGATLYYEVYEEYVPPTAPTLVLLHGVGGNHASWYLQIAEWRTQFRLIIWDARGFGNSTDPQSHGRDRFVEDLLTILDATDTKKCVLVGQSMGGGTALSLTCKHPDRVSALVLADTLFGIEMAPHQQTRMQILSQRNADLLQVERVLGRTTIADSPTQCALYTLIASFNSVNVRTLRGTQELNSPKSLAATGVPVLFIVGEEDVLFPPSEVEIAARSVEGADFIRLPQSGHSAYFETPEIFNQAVVSWLASKEIAGQ